MDPSRLVAKALKTGYREFLTKIHPDYFINYPKARLTNQDLIKSLELPLKSLVKGWSSQDSPKAIGLFNEKVPVNFYIFDINKELVNMEHKLCPCPKEATTLSIFGMFSKASVPPHPEIVRYLNLRLAMTNNSLNTNFFSGDGAFSEVLSSSSFTGNLAIVSQELSHRRYLKFDGTLNKFERMEAIRSLTCAIDVLDLAERLYRDCIPSLLITNDLNGGCNGHIRLPPSFTREGFLMI